MSSIKFKSLMAFTVLILSLQSFSQNPNFVFIKNKGQWNDTVKFKVPIANGALFLTDAGFVYHFIHEDDLQSYNKKHCGIEQPASIQGSKSPTPFRHHAYKVTLLGAQVAQSTFDGIQKLPWHHNYFIGNDTSTWKSSVELYEGVVQKDIYPGIDLSVYQVKGRIKYDFIVSPGSDYREIKLKYEGVETSLNKNGDLVVHTSVNKLVEEAPIIYQKIEGQKINISGRYKLINNELTYELLGKYNNEYPLIIDPSLIFATYSGASSSQNLAYASTYDREGNFYASGEVREVGWPATIGAFQTQHFGSNDIGINKYSADGSALLYSTYLGGSGNETCRAMVENNLGELVIVGRTSSHNMPTLTNSFSKRFNGNNDLYIAKLNSDGTELLGATYFGSYFNPISDGLAPSEVAIGKDNTIWITSTVSVNTSPSGSIPPLPISSNTVQASSGGGLTDGIVIQFDNELSNLRFSTFIGGDSSDACTGIVINQEGNAIISGYTNSTNFPTTVGAIHPTSVGGPMDGFVMVINTDNYSIAQSTYIGTDAEDNVMFLQLDEYGNILVLGQTNGAYPISPFVYHNPTGDIFIDKLSKDLSTSLISTRLGNVQSGPNQFNPRSFLYDKCGRTYITGYGGYNMPITANALNFWTGIWVGVLDLNFSELHFGTYFGTPSDHPHPSISRLDPKGVVYQNVCTGSPNYPTSANAAFPTKNINNDQVDVVSFKIDLVAEFVEASIALAPSSNDSGCVPHTVTFSNDTYCPYPVQFTWDFGDGSPVDTNAQPTHTFTTPGLYTVILTAVSPLSCNIEDADTFQISVFLDEGPDIYTNDTIICQHEESLELFVGINNLKPWFVTEWGPFNGLLSDRHKDTVLVNPNLSEQFWVQVQDTTSFCAISFDTITLHYYPRALDILNQDTLMCVGDTVQIAAIGSEGYSYRWSPKNGINEDTALNPYIIAGSTTTYTLTASHPFCADTSDFFTLQADSPLNARYIAKPIEICIGEPIYLLPTLDSTAASLTWIFGDQSRTEVSLTHNYQHAFESAGKHPITLEMRYRACPSNKFTDTITVYPYPEVDLGGDSSICLHGAPVYLKNLRATPRLGQSYLWNTGDTTAELKVVHPGNYTLSITTEPIGCTTTESIQVNKDCYIDIPNAFTPNGDGHNDYFFPLRLLSENVSRFKMQIFNRWGQLIFETANQNGRGWDGRLNNQVQPMGVYLYRIEVDFENGLQEAYQGNVTLIR